MFSPMLPKHKRPIIARGSELLYLLIPPVGDGVSNPHRLPAMANSSLIGGAKPGAGQMIFRSASDKGFQLASHQERLHHRALDRGERSWPVFRG